MHITSVRSQPVQSSGTYSGTRGGGGVPDGVIQEMSFLPSLGQAVSLVDHDPSDRIWKGVDSSADREYVTHHSQRGKIVVVQMSGALESEPSNCQCLGAYRWKETSPGPPLAA